MQPNVATREASAPAPFVCQQVSKLLPDGSAIKCLFSDEPSLTLSRFLAGFVGPADQIEFALEALVKDAPAFVAAHVTLASVYYRLRRKADGDREQAIVNQLNAAQQAKERGAQDKPKP